MAITPATAAREDSRSDGSIVSVPMADDVAIFKGTFVMIDAAGRATPAAQTASLVFAGVAYESVDNTLTGHTAGGKSIRIWLTGIFQFTAAGTITQADVGAQAWMDSTNTTGTNYSILNVDESDPGICTIVGRIVEYISSTSVRVRIDGYAMNAAGTSS